MNYKKYKYYDGKINIRHKNIHLHKCANHYFYL